MSTTTWDTAAATSFSSVHITSNVTWTATSNASWLTIAPTNGTGSGTLMMMVAANTSAASRIGRITVTSGGISRTITVTQAGTAVFSLTPTIWNPASGTALTFIYIASNVPWTATSNASWLVASPTSGTDNGLLLLTVATNLDTASRVGTITVTGGGISRTITVTQRGR
ncbi:MAG: BACON domain-containing protein [Peptococcaceae bacterium]|nr:BACON domain-containing protein [Peptococcaceae bacterium]